MIRNISRSSRSFVLSPVADDSRDIGALAGQEMESRLADSVGGLRRGLAQVPCLLTLIVEAAPEPCSPVVKLQQQCIYTGGLLCCL